jgi:hypothetical protein
VAGLKRFAQERRVTSEDWVSCVVMAGKERDGVSPEGSRCSFKRPRFAVANELACSGRLHIGPGP